MPSPLESLVATGTKLWLDSVDPDLVEKFKGLGATGATSNPIIISDLIKTGRFDDDLQPLFDKGLSDEDVAWAMTDKLVSDAQQAFKPAFEKSKGETGYVSFELDPLLEDAGNPLSIEQRADRYVELGKRWSKGHSNRMIKVPATPAGLAALERLAAEGVTLNVTLVFSDRQYRASRDAIWRGAQRRKSGLNDFKSVYSIFISRIDVCTQKQVPELSEAAQGQVGLLNAKRIWTENNAWWSDKKLRLHQEIVFASTGVKEKGAPPDKYVSALAGSDIQTNPPATNDAIHQMAGKTFTRTVDKMPPQAVIEEIDKKVDFQKLEDVLMSEGTKKFAEPHKALLKLIAEKRAALTAAR
jgi:transaldolase